MNRPVAYIHSSGVISAIGGNSTMMAAAVKAGITSVSETDYYDRQFNPIRLGMIPDAAIEPVLDGEKLIMDDLTGRQFRMLQLATAALLDLAADIPDGVKVPVFLAGPETIVDTEQSVCKVFLQNLAIQSGVNIDLGYSRSITTGRAGGLEVIDIARKYFDLKIADIAVIGGVDSYYDKDILHYYTEQQRLMAFGAGDGFIPGEGAGFLLLVSPHAPAELKAACNAHITGIGLGRESGHLNSDSTYRGDGLAEAVRDAVTVSKNHGIHTVMSTMNGEHYFAKELGVMIARNRLKFMDDMEIRHLAEFCGDLGAASGPVMISILQNCGWLNEGDGLVYCSSDGEDRSAICLSQNTSEGREGRKWLN